MSRSTPCRRPGMSPLEILVAVSVIVVLVALLVPAIMSIREASFYTQCKNNLKQIGLALHNYQETYGKFPPGIVLSPETPTTPPPMSGYFPNGTNPCTGTVAFLLPFMEHDDIYKKIPADYFNFQSTQQPWAYAFAPIDSSASNYDNNTGIPTWALNRVKSLECPSDNVDAQLNTKILPSQGLNRTIPNVGVVDFYVYQSAGTAFSLPTWDFLPPTSPSFSGPNVADLGRTNYVANGGTLGNCNNNTSLQTFLTTIYGPGYIPSNTTLLPPFTTSTPYTNSANLPTDSLASFAGPFGVNSQTRITDIRDGTAYTIAFGETVGGQQFPDGTTDFRVAWAGGAVFPAVMCSQKVSSFGVFSSNHTTVSNFLWCDGSVRPIRKIPVLSFDPPPSFWSSFQAAAGMQDGKVLDLDDLSD